MYDVETVWLFIELSKEAKPSYMYDVGLFGFIELSKEAKVALVYDVGLSGFL